MRILQAVFATTTLFTILMALGCGRLFEGDAAQMWTSLGKLAALPDDTVVCSGHEYTQANGRFAETIEPESQELRQRIADIAAARATGTPTVPSLLGLEKSTNPFLRAKEPGIQANLSHDSCAGPTFCPHFDCDQVRWAKENRDIMTRLLFHRIEVGWTRL